MSTLVEEAKEAATNIFISWCTSTLRETACSLLKRKMMMKYNQELEAMTQEENITKDTSNNNDDIHFQINIEEEDLQDVYKSTIRIGKKWVDKLIESGEDEFAKVVGHVCSKGGFLEEDSEVEQIGTEDSEVSTVSDQSEVPGWKNSCQIQKRRKTGDEAEEELSCSSVLPGQTLSNGMHLPQAALVRTNTASREFMPSPKMEPYPLIADHRSEWLRNQIKLVDKLATSGESSWPYDWSIIQDAASSVTTRLHNNLHNYQNSKLEVIPKVLIEQEAATCSNNDDDSLIAATSSSLSVMLGRKRRREIRSSQIHNTATASENDAIIARPPCPKLKTGHILFPWDEIKEEMEQLDDDPDLRHLINPSLDEDQIHHTIQGALKPIGALHLWEQYKSDSTFQPKSINKIIESGKELTIEENKNIVSRIQKRARDERLRLASSKSSQNNIVVPSKKYTTKIVRVGKSNDDTASNNEEWMQFDLGECFLQLLRTNDDVQGNEDNSQKKDWLAFRSIEVSLLD